MRALAAMLLVLVAGPRKGTPTEVSAFLLAQAYEENELAADAAYKGKTLDVTGPVRGVERISGDVYVRLYGGEWRPVMCSLSKSEDLKLATGLRFGDLATLRCRCKGLGLFGVQLDRCRIREVQR